MNKLIQKSKNSRLLVICVVALSYRDMLPYRAMKEVLRYACLGLLVLIVSPLVHAKKSIQPHSKTLNLPECYAKIRSIPFNIAEYVDEKNTYKTGDPIYFTCGGLYPMKGLLPESSYNYKYVKVVLKKDKVDSLMMPAGDITIYGACNGMDNPPITRVILPDWIKEFDYDGKNGKFERTPFESPFDLAYCISLGFKIVEAKGCP